jgi:hypothetical protein
MSNNFWKYGGQILKGEKAQLPVISRYNDDTYLAFSSRDHQGKSFGRLAKISSLYPLQLDEVKTILSPGPLGSYDVAGTMPMQIVDGLLFYIGWTLRKDVPYFNYLSVAKFDGDTTTKLGPVLAPDIYESGYSGTLHVQKVAERFLGYYLSVINWIEDERGELNPSYDIKIAESTDLLHWKRMGQTAVGLRDDEAGISAFTVVEYEKELHAWFSVRKGEYFRDSAQGGYRICHAKSLDGVEWVRDDMFSLGAGDFPGCDHMVAYPSVMVVGGRVIMVFNGNGFGNDGAHWCYMTVESLKVEKH